MQSVSRSFGKLWNKGPGDNAKVSVLLKDYEDADKVLAQIIDNARLWRESWALLVGSQLQIVAEYEGLYDPIVGATDGHGRPSAQTPHLQLERTFRLKEVYADLKTELLAEIQTIEERVIKPALDARDCIAPIRKTIKKRENKRIDYEKAQDKAIKLQRKPGRNPKEEAALAKAEDEMNSAAHEFNIADDHLRETLPPIVAAAFSLIPPLLAGLILIQNRLLGLYYTSLHGYCQDLGFPSPPPPMDEVIATWNSAFKPIQGRVESINCIARGKAIHHPMSHGTEAQKAPVSPTSVKENFRRTSSGLISSGPSSAAAAKPRTLRIPSSNNNLRGQASQTPSEYSPQPSPSSSYKRPDYLAPTDFTTATVLGGAPIDRSMSRSPGASSPNSMRPRDYFSRPSTSSTDVSNASYGSHIPSNNSGFPKKKLPPPPPPKRIPSTKPEEWVVAQYAFTGQGQGDLSFQEGDRIKIVKKTGTDQDWWVGELHGSKGNFPANYCKPL
ncbi:hypothetical protein B0T22DRAFT_368462 [Podospora appendiculata]|uniref:SH3 domain-containing protein n=1 Tax=Podospora appendiculata TaxID=314037 RepID=A0AAE1CII5_9PEZI|nr:hypothetical protein B0T22DRAFT_368462 [Podospora appendiculata]